MSTIYSIHHVTRYSYDSPVREAVMEVRAQPADTVQQTCIDFALSTNPRGHVLEYRDFMGNHVHHFDLPAPHIHQSITTDAIVEVKDYFPIPETLPTESWDRLAPEKLGLLDWELTLASKFAKTSDALNDFAKQAGIKKLDDPLTTVRHINQSILKHLKYRQEITEVNSTIDDALEAGAGVCQDFAHICIALLRNLGIPARYVSGYYAHSTEADNTSSNSQPDIPPSDATHAWFEAYLPKLGWIGFDPTHQELACEKHIKTAIGRDYADVPPTRGVFRGLSESEISVAVKVTALPSLPETVTRPYATTGWVPPEPIEQPFVLTADEQVSFEYQAQQMQQQQ